MSCMRPPRRDTSGKPNGYLRTFQCVAPEAQHERQLGDCLRTVQHADAAEDLEIQTLHGSAFASGSVNHRQTETKHAMSTSAKTPR